MNKFVPTIRVTPNARRFCQVYLTLFVLLPIVLLLLRLR